MKKITRSNQFFFQTEGESTKVTVCGKCIKCQNVIDHDCQFGPSVLKSAQKGMNINLVTSENGFKCKICTEHVPHTC